MSKHLSIFSYLSDSFLLLGWQASSGLLARPARSCDLLYDDHMTAVVNRRSEEWFMWLKY